MDFTPIRPTVLTNKLRSVTKNRKSLSLPFRTSPPASTSRHAPLGRTHFYAVEVVASALAVSSLPPE